MRMLKLLIYFTFEPFSRIHVNKQNLVVNLNIGGGEIDHHFDHLYLITVSIPGPRLAAGRSVFLIHYGLTQTK